MAVSKLHAYCLREAKKEVADARKRVRDPEWMAQSSGMSREWAERVASADVKALAKQRCDYLWMRACVGAKGFASGQRYVDQNAVNQIEEVTGRKLVCPKKWRDAGKKLDAEEGVRERKSARRSAARRK